ncbi:unnamed protein product [Heligmosomoides polygyrus]|uniref:Integrase_H2C2 domain-containing protein n=1 Tax=Heligmosomoides polygyrus TaxID=6339 RepID=A0A183FGY1_HELPZ|nr:unnamed protein product [Heligmosomoides polygyrus]
MPLVLLFLRKKLLRRLREKRQRQVFERVPELKNFPEDVNTAHITPHYRKSAENTLRLFKDNDCIWRSKGRIGNSSLNSDAKSPIFISPKTPLTTLIINEAHGEYHQGIEHAMSTIRMKYWIPRLRQQKFLILTQTNDRSTLLFRTLPHYEKYNGEILLCTRLGKEAFTNDSLNLSNTHYKNSLTTILTEVEACLNWRPLTLTYQGAEQGDYSSIRPIDFIQSDMDVILPHDFGAEDSAEDPEYALPERMTALKTRNGAESALKSSCKYTEHFWNIWQNHYLTRNLHKIRINKASSSSDTKSRLRCAHK